MIITTLDRAESELHRLRLPAARVREHMSTLQRMAREMPGLEVEIIRGLFVRLPGSRANARKLTRPARVDR